MFSVLFAISLFTAKYKKRKWTSVQCANSIIFAKGIIVAGTEKKSK